MKPQLILYLFLFIGYSISSHIEVYAQEKTIKQLEFPYYIFPRQGDQHIDLSNNWNLGHTDNPINSLAELNDTEWFNVEYPTSVQMAHYKAGKLGDPYKNMNALEHEKLEQKVWYYKKDFIVPENAKGKNILLNFDGIDYFAKVWLNDKLLGTHTGIFGGPTLISVIKSDMEKKMIW